MGLNCSRQGYIRDFHDLQDTRLAPEGQCFPVDLLKSDGGSQQFKEKLTALLQDDKLAKRLSVGLCISNFENERVLYGQEGCKANEIVVALPPEGKVCNDFVELPKEKSKHYDKSQSSPLIVDLPTEKCASEEKELFHQVQVRSNIHTQYFDNECKRKDSTDSSKVSSSGINSNSILATEEEENGEDDQWMYTLYDFQENGIVTKQDVNRLMDSICSVVNSTLSSSEQATQDESSQQNNNLKVHLEIGRRKKSSNHNDYQNNHDTHTIHSRHSAEKSSSSSRYLSSRRYKGLIFPPPNSEEAEKVSSYIEERLLNHRHRLVSHDKNNHRTYNNDGQSMSSLKSTCKRCSASSRSRCHTKSPPRSCTVQKQRDRDKYDKRADRILVTTKPLLHRTESNEHYKKRNGSCDVSNSDHSLSPSSMSGSNTPFSCDEVFSQQKNSDKESIAVSENSRFRHSCQCRRKPKLASCDNIYESNNRYRTNTKTKQREHIQAYSSRSSSQGENSAGSNEILRHEQQKSMTEGRNEHRKKFRRHTNEINTAERPDVWPGCAASVVGEKPVKIKNPEEICFCKRMLGLDYPCNHPL